MKLSPWITVEGHCATRVIEGSDPNDIKNRIAFIEKTPRIRIPIRCPVTINGNQPETPPQDLFEWIQGPKGSDPYGKYEPSRQWCDQMLQLLGYTLS